MALRNAVLAALLHGPASGWDLQKRMDVSTANFWPARPAQIYAELQRLEADELIAGEEVAQRGRPNKRVFSLTEDGHAALHAFAARPPRPTAIKDELLVAVHAATPVTASAVAAALDARRDESAARLAVYEQRLAALLGDRDEASLVASGASLGPYLTLSRGRAFERENVAWCAWAAELLRARHAPVSASAAASPSHGEPLAG